MGLLLLMGQPSPTIQSGPNDATEAEGNTATFQVISQNVSVFRWQRSEDAGANFTDIEGANASSYTTPPLTKDYNNNLFRVVASNSVGTVTSPAATLRVTAGPE